MKRKNHLIQKPITDFVPNEVIIKFKDNYNLNIKRSEKSIKCGLSTIDSLFVKFEAADISSVFKKYKKINDTVRVLINGKYVQTPNLENIFKITFNDSIDIDNIINQFSSDTTIEYVEPNFIFNTLETIPNDPIYQTGVQWYIDTIAANLAWDSTTSDTSQIIAILDTGIDWDHPDLQGNMWRNWDELPDNGIDDDNNGYIDDIRGWDFINNDGNPNDDNSHGTHVAGIAAAVTNNSLGVAGIAWHAKIMPVKVLQSTGQGNAVNLSSGIAYAASNGANLINMSLGSYAESITVRNALVYAYSTSVLVAAAGNDFYPIDYMPMFPACYSYVLGVQATNFDNNLTDFTNYDEDGPIISAYSDQKNYEIMAPGFAIYSTFPNGLYHALNGTSMATPIVCGAICLIKSHLHNISTEELYVRLIQGTNNGVLNVYNSLTISPEPYLKLFEYSFFDTLPGCDHDGNPDAGEDIVISIKVKNFGGYADSVWSVFRLGTYEDTTVATVVDSNYYIGDISEYALLDNVQDKFIFHIDSKTAHNRDIVFNCLVGSQNSDTIISNQIIIKVYNGEELKGYVDSNMVLTPDKLWLVNSSFALAPGRKITMMPGTHLKMNKVLVLGGIIEGFGTPDSLIYLHGPAGIYGGNAEFTYAYFDYVSEIISDSSKSLNEFRYCTFDGALATGNVFKHCVIKNQCPIHWGADTILYCNFENVGCGLHIFEDFHIIAYNNFSRMGGFSIFEVPANGQCFENNLIYPSTGGPYAFVCWGSVSPQYYGTTNTELIDNIIYDFHENPNCGITNYQPILTAPTPLAHGVVWKVEINGKNPQDSIIDPIGAETVKFDVYFNRPMDNTVMPKLSFGVREPYNQHQVYHIPSWSTDSLVWTAYYTFGLETGDGLNFIRVQEAVDNEGFEIPVENNKRFSFIVQAAGAASLNFYAYPGIGRINLYWQPAASSDVLGYNMYRFNSNGQGTFTDTILVNSYLITDTTFVDYEVIPDTTYHYLYKVVGTDLVESDFSKSVSAVPLNSISGDANGDGVINILDITTVVAYMLLQNPAPFIFNAADVNSDGNINVLDIIGIVQLVLNGNKSSVAENNQDEFFLNPAYIKFDKEGIGISSDGNIAGLQFKILLQDLPNVSVKSMLNGFEFSSVIVQDTLICVFYNFSNHVISEEVSELLKIHGNDYSYTIIDILACDPNGRIVPVYLNKYLATDGNRLEILPNPVTNNSLIRFVNASDSYISFQIFNLNGEMINFTDSHYFTVGSHSISINELLPDGQNLLPGTYLINMDISSVSNQQSSTSLSRKIIVLR